MGSLGPITLVLIVVTLLFLTVGSLLLPGYEYGSFWSTVEEYFDQDIEDR